VTPVRTSLVVLDFSGTLSLDAVAFAAPGRIEAELQRTGLWDLGIDAAGLFWDELIAPTWQEGSTTDRGYAAVVSAAASEVLRSRGRAVDPDALRRRVQAFAGRYLACSTIAPQWRGYLRALADRDDTATVVATDHYADATGHIVAELGRLGLRGVPVAAGAGAAAGVVTVANSADVGCHKASVDFWRAIHRALRPITASRVVLVDDFGANEASGDAYGTTRRVRQRRLTMTTVLAAAFRTEPEVHPFTLPRPAASDDDVAAMVDSVERFTMSVLSTSS
jgi:hypothetical protein